MRRHDARVVTWQTWVGRVHVTVDRYRCGPCRAERRPLLDVLGVEPGRLSGWLARQLALLGSVVPYTLAAELATPLLGVRAHAMMVWRAATGRPGGRRRGVVGMQARSTRRRRPTPTTPLAPLPPRTDPTFREVKTAVLLQPHRPRGRPGPGRARAARGGDRAHRRRWCVSAGDRGGPRPGVAQPADGRRDRGRRRRVDLAAGDAVRASL